MFVYLSVKIVLPNLSTNTFKINQNFKAYLEQYPDECRLVIITLKMDKEEKINKMQKINSLVDNLNKVEI